ncbi:hypothetical protein [uncultured Mediterranean phage uvMED]|nr:hypothetical protein [uncultured Mediterranean phage uvMED]
MTGLMKTSADSRSKTIGQNFRVRAWVNFDGGTGSGPGNSDITIRGSGNVSSITDNDGGDYTVNYTSTMPDVNYTVFGSAIGSSSTNYWSYAASYGGSTITTSSCRFIFVHHAGSQNDMNHVSFCVIR